jgi:hypothetical protein
MTFPAMRLGKYRSNGAIRVRDEAVPTQLTPADRVWYKPHTAVGPSRTERRGTVACWIPICPIANARRAQGEHERATTISM